MPARREIQACQTALRVQAWLREEHVAEAEEGFSDAGTWLESYMQFPQEGARALSFVDGKRGTRPLSIGVGNGASRLWPPSETPHFVYRCDACLVRCASRLTSLTMGAAG